MDTPIDNAANHATPPTRAEFRWIDLGSWFVRRNPLYLLSAAAMALAARFLLVDPDTRAGDIAHILLTLAVIQLYEMTVTAILLLLSRYRRSPEDLPSLLLVGTVFWTAPFAASGEMTARHGAVGIGLSLAAALLAVAEFELVRRSLKLRISAFGRAAALGVVFLIALLPILLLPSASTGRASEVALLAGWWILAAIVIVVALAAGSAGNVQRISSGESVPESFDRDEIRTRHGSGGSTTSAVGSDSNTTSTGESADNVLRPEASERASARNEIGWLILLILIAGVQCVGMNHAFYLHATAAHAAPIVVLLAYVLTAGREIFGRAAAFISIAVFVLPIVGIALAGGGFDAKYVQPELHWLVARPLAVVSLMAGLVWWYAYRRGLGSIFLHAGAAAVAAGAALLVTMESGTASTLLGSSVWEKSAAEAGPRLRIALAAGMASVYFAVCAVLRKSRAEGVFALALAAGAVILFTWRIVSADVAIAAAALFWFWFFALHVAIARPSMRQLTCVVTFGVLMTLLLDGHGPSRGWAWMHAPAIPLALAITGLITHRREYALLACGATAAPLAYLALRTAAQVRLSRGAAAAVFAFGLLIAGAAVSWFKRRESSSPLGGGTSSAQLPVD